MTPAELPPDVVDAADAGPPPASLLSSVAKDPLLHHAFREYHRLREQGRAPDKNEWCLRFPSCGRALWEMLTVEGNLGEFLDHLPPPPIPLPSADEELDWPYKGEKRQGFLVGRELARGSFARIYLATEPSAGDRLVVLKISRHGDAEARMMGPLSHPHVVPILSARREKGSGLTMVCMPYLGSATLENVLERLMALPPSSRPRKADFLLEAIRSRTQPEDPPAPPADARLRKCSYTDGVIHLAAQLAETLAYVHQRGVCHRDLKPSNVLLDPSGKPLLLDFNMSQTEREAALFVGGTLHYMAPEQIRAFLRNSKGDCNERCDLFALAVMVFELLAGDHPCGELLPEPDGKLVGHFLLERWSAGFRPFRQVCPDLERPVAAVLDRCLAFEAAERPASAAELAAELKRQFTPARRLRRRLAAHPRLTWAALLLLLTTALAGGYAWMVTPPYSERAFQRGKMAYRAGDYDAAEQHFDRAVRAEPNNPRYRQARGCARLQQSKRVPSDKAKLDQVLEDLTAAEQGQADPISLAVNAYVKVRRHRYEDAIRAYKQPALASYRPVTTFNNRAFCLLSVGRWKEAQADLDEAVKVDPHCPTTYHNRAVLAFQKRINGETPVLPLQSLADVDQALQLGPPSAALYRDAALLYAQAASDEFRRGAASLNAPLVTALLFQRGETQRQRALFLLRQAIASGEPPVSFRRSSLLRTALERPAFAALIAEQRSQSLPQPGLRLLDPIEIPD
jgi:serine/threonine protein kinase/Tfp pilus assembly protein PilF